ncbi:alpha/beta hydrolase [Microbacterium timonense]|uniref:alpha/beta hydrolase n=1 Tax=Microbacterium timonense TaxID=2086576 RepID=UPI000D111768|nr:alpha/beta hydrolase [Microbacterium timonense]
MNQDAPTRHGRRGLRIAGYTLLVLTGLIIVVLVVGAITPWPSAMLIRSVFERGGDETAAEMERHQPSAPVEEQLGLEYGAAGDETTTFDVFRPQGAEGPLPTIVWVHGGAWISGSSANVDPYLRILAAEGYTTVGLNYELGPEGTYPTAVVQLNEALAYLDDNAADLGIDPDHIVLAGDSAGAQLASQLAVLTTNDRYARLMGIDPALESSQLSGVILNCGVYDMPAMAELDGIVAWGFQIALWAYTGTKSWSAGYEGATMSTIDFVTADFPPTYISGGNADGLTWLQSIPMSQRLRDAGVPVTEKFWAADHSPALPHEYQFHLDLPDAQDALQTTIDWLGETVGTDAQP